MTILGCDPGLASFGYGAIVVHGHKLELVRCGVLRTKPQAGLAAGTDTAVRCNHLAVELAKILDELRPDTLAFEAFISYGHVVTSTIQLANVTGMLRELCRARSIPVSEYSAVCVKKAVAGNRSATKHEVARAVARLLGLPMPPKTEHESDALACAITHYGTMPRLLIAA